MTRILLHQDLAGAHVTFNYDAGLVELIKTTIPKHLRGYDKTSKTWTIKSRSASWAFIRAAEQMGHTVHVTGDRDYRPPKPSAAPAGTWADDLLKRAPRAARKKIIQHLSRDLHPDAGGDTELMSELNRAAEKWRTL